MSPELQVLAAPARAYRRLASGHHVSVSGAAARPVRAALIIAVAVAIYATGRVTAGLVLSLVVSWSFVLAVQLAAAAVLLAAARPAGVSRASAIDLLFMGDGPWSLWLLVIAGWAACAAWAASPPPSDAIVAVSAIVPLVWTAVILFWFCAVVLQAPLWRAARLLLLHQVTVWGLTFLYIAAAIGLWPRVLGVIRQ